LAPRGGAKQRVRTKASSREAGANPYKESCDWSLKDHAVVAAMRRRSGNLSSCR